MISQKAYLPHTPMEGNPLWHLITDNYFNHS